jgi:ATP-dependent DNA helicase DinG
MEADVIGRVVSEKISRPSFPAKFSACPPPPAATAHNTAEALIHEACREQIVREIESIGGGEVFFVGRLDASMKIVEVEAYAFGNAGTVPALMQYARPGDVILHNHPSGNLEPSGADINLSALAGERGVGSYIIDNACGRVRVVVKAMAPPARKRLDPEPLEAALAPDGPLARHLGEYEYRPSQVAMLRAVAEALNAGGLAAIEAPTGTGKSMAYLLPAVAWSLRNNERVVISTETINLQEQLIGKDLPLLREALYPDAGTRDASGNRLDDFSAVLVKGRNNYLCRRKADYLERHRDFAADPEKQEQMDAILTWIKTTSDGSRSDLAFQPDPDVWEKVMSEADNCLRTQCPFYQSCFFYNAKRRAARANVLVVNHHLLLADLALRAESENYTESAVLPPFQRIVLDEAHHLEDVATQYFGSRVSRIGLAMGLRRLAHPRTGEGLLHYLANQIYGDVYLLAPDEKGRWGARLTRDLVFAVRELESRLDEAAERTGFALAQWSGEPREGAGEGAPSELRRRVTAEMAESNLWAREIRDPLLGLLKAGRELLQQLDELHTAIIGAIPEETPETLTPAMELRAARRKLDRQLGMLARFLDDPGGRCVWVEYRDGRGGRPPAVAYCSAPLRIADDLRENLLRKYPTVVMTSATLAVGGKFDYFLGRIGAADRSLLGLTGSGAAGPEAAARPGAERPLSTVLLDSPFDFERQVYVGVPLDLPSPTEAAFEPALAGFLERSLCITEGRAFVLFTAYGALGRTYDRVAPALSRSGIACLRQGTQGRTQLTEAFRQDIGSVLFATSSFWEGVDVPGEALSCVVLTRLPFGVPDEPVLEARVEAMKQRGEDWFRELIVPRAVIRFRQGFGRLIRRRGDRGAVLICDNRVARMGYGQTFLKSLPTRRVHVAPADSVLTALGAFFAAAEPFDATND